MNGIPTLFSWPRRLMLAGLAFAGSTIYALSFANMPQRNALLPIAEAIGIAAGISWILFGLLLLGLTRGRPAIFAWADACLITMAAGMAVKMLTALANLLSTPSITFHVIVLLTANLVMAIVFIRRAKLLGMRPILAAGLWFGALNGIFAALMWGFRAAGWYH